MDATSPRRHNDAGVSLVTCRAPPAGDAYLVRPAVPGRNVMNTVHRRRFLQAAVASVTAAGIGSEILAGQQGSLDGIPTRPLGKTSQQVSVVGLGV